MLEIVLDTETTGLSVKDGHRIVEIGCIELENQIPTKKFFRCLLNPEKKVSEEALKIHGYSDEFLSKQKKFSEIGEDFLRFIDDKKLIIHNADFDLSHLNNELKKVENFARSGKKISIEDIFKLSNLAGNYNASELTDNCLAKNIKKTANILNENNYSNEDCILIVRTLLTKTKRLLQLQKEVKKNKSIEQVITNFKPPIFWKHKEIVKQQMNHWPLEKINNMINNINEIELLIKKNSASSLNILSDFIINQTNKANN